MNHILLNGKIGEALWDKLLSNLDDPIDKNNIDTLCYTLCRFKQNNMRNVIKFTTIEALLWSLWNERNN